MGVVGDLCLRVAIHTSETIFRRHMRFLSAADAPIVEA
jgi:hypothetical protein